MNWLKTTIRRIVPPPHRPVRWTAAIPLMVFAVLFAMVVFSILPTFIVGWDPLESLEIVR